MIFALLLISFCAYTSIVLFILIGTFRKKRDLPHACSCSKISVIIAAKNEEQDIEALCEALCTQDYPRHAYEIILVDDHSTDKTTDIMAHYAGIYNNVQHITIAHEHEVLCGKKHALTHGIDCATGEILAFTDADCIPTNKWLQVINDYFAVGYDAVTGYSPLKTHKTTLGSQIIMMLKNLERLSMFTVSAGTLGWNWAVTCTGRNFAYRRRVFYDLNGYEHIDHVRSGDDDLFLQKIGQRKKYHLGFMIDPRATVLSTERKSAKAQFNQEKRRGSKFALYSRNVKLIAGITFAFYLLFIGTFVGILFGYGSVSMWLTILGIKIVTEALVVLRGAYLFHNVKPLILFPIAEILYIPYFIFFGLVGSFSHYQWHDDAQKTVTDHRDVT